MRWRGPANPMPTPSAAPVSSWRSFRPLTPVSTIGAKGVGEIGITGVAASIANAVFHATGKRICDLPIRVDKIIA